MKKFILKNILLSIAILLTFCSILIIPNGGEIEKVSSYASYTRLPSQAQTPNSQNAMSSPDGNIPFSLYTSLKKGDKDYEIVDYHPTFTTSTQNQGPSLINHYTIDANSTPYILLSSYNGGDGANLPEKENFEQLYKTTLFFKFNDQSFKGQGVDENTIPTQAGFMDVTATVNGTQISVPINTSNATTDDASLEFAVNLMALGDTLDDNTSFQCPNLLDGTPLGGANDNNTSFRTGLYEFTIEYSYKDSVSNVSNKCIFEISFYILDYYSYVESSSPIAFDNTDTYCYTKEGKQTPSNYELYNYNYIDAPVVWIDSTKFALNFVYTTGYTNYVFNYGSFIYRDNITSNKYKPENVFSNASIGEKTGSITLKFKDNDELTYTIYTYMEYAKNKDGSVLFNDIDGDGVFDASQNLKFSKTDNILYNDINNNDVLDAGEDEIEDIIIPYYAKFNLKDFEENFLIKYGFNTNFLGQYAFDLDFLVQNNDTYTTFPNENFDNFPDEINNQKLVLFGYNLKYSDQESGKNLELKNEVTHTNFIAYNSATNDGKREMNINTGLYKNIPNYIAVTNQAPLRFDYYGNLKNYSSHFASLDYKDTSLHSKILDEYFNVVNLTELDNNLSPSGLSILTNSYTQGASISSDGIRIMKMAYSLSFLIDGVNQTIEGCQYIVFEINNTVQNLYVQGVDNSRDKIEKLYDFKDYTNKNVLVSIEDKPNTFFAPFNVSYNYYPTFNTADSYTTGLLNLKTNSSNNTKEVIYIGDKTFNYYVTNKTNNFTFTNSGIYRVCIKNSVTNTPSYYYFAIDKESFSNISANKASLNQSGTNYTLDTAISTSLLEQSSNDFVKTDLIVTNNAFTLSWSEKRSGAKSFSYVFYMETNKQNNLDGNMLKTKTTSPEYWITNGNIISSPSSAIDTFVNHATRPYDNATLRTKVLKNGEYYTKEGLYIFYVYDEAGNFFTRSILLDTSKGTILQGEWSDPTKPENSQWSNTYDPDGNPSNYVDENTTLYFGTHKALQLPDLTSNYGGKVSFEDISFTREYTYNNDGIYQALTTKTPIEIKLYSDILARFTSFVKSDTNASFLVGEKDAKYADTTFYYLTVENSSVSYSKKYETGTDETGAGIEAISEGTLSKSDLKSATIYKIENPYDIYNFYGEAYYKFDLTNGNGADLVNGEKDEGTVSVRIIQMNFDKIQGTFKAYGNGDNNDDLTEHEIRKNSGTNLNVLNFEYKDLESDPNNKLARYYTVAKLEFNHYAFVLDDSAYDEQTKNSYPFASTITTSGDLLIGKAKVGDKIRINAINIDASGKTIPGKYILTREYVGGTHDLVDGEYVPTQTGTGGSYVPQLDKNGNQLYDETTGKPLFENLFEFDTLKRNYTVYVDHNGIITTSYMVRNDDKENVREVGDNISITLSNTYDDSWEFKEFFLTSSSTLALNTNKVPVKVNIPLSKYFVEYYSGNNNWYAKQSFAKLEIVITYYASPSSPAVYYKIDGFDSNGLCTCSKLDKTNEQLIFSSSGNYIISINDRTGYTDATSSDKDADNKFPTTYTYSFSISHTAPDASTYSNTYYLKDAEFELKKLTNEDNSTNFATNIKKENIAIADLDGDGELDNEENNKVLISWSDPLTPYQAKINQFNVKVKDKNNIILNTIELDLKNYEHLFAEIAQSETKLLEIPSEIRDFILYFKVVPYRELIVTDDLLENKELKAKEPSYQEDPEKDELNVSIYDHTQYYRYSYIVNLDITDEYKYEITLSYLSNSSTNQGYYDENGNSFATSLYTLTIDRTKPNTNIDKLLNDESYLVTSNYYNNGNLSNFKEENFEVSSLLQTTPSAFTYAFGVSNNFALTYDNSDTAPYFYVRSYDKYKSEYTSITPDMIDSVYDVSKAYYTDMTNFAPNYPRFAEVLFPNSNIVSIGGQYGQKANVWYKINYQPGTTLYQQLTTTFEKAPSGFYEIIEKDNAGNYRNYTIYYNKYASLYQNLEIDGHTQKDNIIYLVSNGEDANEDEISAGIFFTATNISTTLGWGTITVTNATAGINYNQDIVITPFDDPKDTVNQLKALNEFLDCKFSSKLTFRLEKYNATYTEPALTRHINLSIDINPKLPPPTIEEVFDSSNAAVSYNLILPVYNSKSYLYLEEFSLQQLTANNTWVALPEYSFVGKDNIPQKITGLTKGTYKAIYKDNFNDATSVHPLYIGEKYIDNFDEQYNFEFGSYYSTTEKDINNEDITVYYSGGYIDVTYESNIYKVYLTTNNSAEVLISGSANEIESPTLANCKTFRLTPTELNKETNYNDENKVKVKVDRFTLNYVDILDNSIIQKTINFAIFDTLPEILLTNSFGSAIEVIGDTTTTNSSVKISWNNFEDNTLDTELQQLVATLYIRNENGEYKNGIKVNKGQIVTQEGHYKVELSNKALGNFNSIYFEINYSYDPLYKVIDKINNTDVEISASPYETLNLKSDSNPQGSPITKIIDTIYNTIQNITEIEADKSLLLDQIDAISNTSNVKHFYTTGNARIDYSDNIDLKILEFVFKNDEFQSGYFVDDLYTTNYENYSKTGISYKNTTPSNVGNDYWTTIFLLYNLDGPIKVEFFALTKVPKTSALINSLTYKNEVLNRDDYKIDLKTNPISTTLTNAEILNNDIILYWNALPNSNTKKWYNAGNVIVLQDTYGVETYADNLVCVSNPRNSAELTTTLVGSGRHKLVFKDWAGNIHEFASTSYSPQKFYSILLIDSVIYNINYQGTDFNPIQYGVFNEGLDIVLDSEYLTFYSELNFNVERNGTHYNGYEVNENIYSFTTPGRYTVTISASYGEPNKPKDVLNNVVYNFTILSSNSARLAYEFIEVPGYEIIEITRNGQDITNSFDSDNDGKILSLFVSSTSGGNGYYSVKLKYGTKSHQVQQFNFTINDYIPTIASNVKHGETTQGSIIISYNPSIIYEQLGECYIKVLTYNNDSKEFVNYATVLINEDSFTNANTKSFEITRSNSYFIQVETKNGNIISSFRVNKTDPLNTMAIIIIIIAVIAAVVLTIVIIKLRTKMKIR